jgi:hypothetical protein
MYRRWAKRVAPVMALAFLALVLLAAAPGAQAQQWRGNYPAYTANNWRDHDHDRWRDNRRRNDPYWNQNNNAYWNQQDRNWRRDRAQRERWERERQQWLREHGYYR